MRERRRPSHPVHPAIRSRTNEASAIQTPIIKPRVSYTERGRNWGMFGRTWSDYGAHLYIVEVIYPIVHDSVQGDVDCNGDEGEESRDE